MYCLLDLTKCLLKIFFCENNNLESCFCICFIVIQHCLEICVCGHGVPWVCCQVKHNLVLPLLPRVGNVGGKHHTGVLGLEADDAAIDQVDQFDVAGSINLLDCLDGVHVVLRQSHVVHRDRIEDDHGIARGVRHHVDIGSIVNIEPEKIYLNKIKYYF